MQKNKAWKAGVAPISVILISLNEAHNLRECLDNLAGFAGEVFLVDSYSKDTTIDIALEYGIHVVQRKFINFGDQWNFALRQLPISNPWTMKLDPDERISEKLKKDILAILKNKQCDGIKLIRRWWLMGRPLNISDQVLRIWKTGSCSFTNISVNEHPLVKGKICLAKGVLEHMDSPSLEHWILKQNNYSTNEAVNKYRGMYADAPKLFGTSLQRRMWLKILLERLPFRYFLLFIYFFLYKGLWRSGRVGYLSAQLWIMFYRVKECKYLEMCYYKREHAEYISGYGVPDIRVEQF